MLVDRPRGVQLAHHVERFAGEPDRPHGVVDPAAAEAGLGDDERLALAAEQGGGRHPDVLIVDERVVALAQPFAAQPDVALDVDARRVRRHQEHRHALVRADVGIRDRHDDEERRGAGVGGEELPPVDDPVAAVPDGQRLELGRVGTGVRLGHRVTREDLAVEQRPQVALLLLRRAEVGDDLGVPGCPCPSPPSSGPR
jgi:hypothetical protein